LSNHEDFLRYADECLSLAEDGDVARRRATLETMAQTWRRLAAEEERIADLIREVDHLFSAPDETAGVALRRASGGAKSGLRSH
jgi:hypothetical protein